MEPGKPNTNQFVTSLLHYLSIALYIFIHYFSFYPPKLDFPMPLHRLYDLYHITYITFHKIFYEEFVLFSGYLIHSK